MEEIDFYLEEAADSMNKAVEHFAQDVAKIRAGKASVNMFDGVSVEYYGTKTPINQVSSVNAQDAKTIVIKPWERICLILLNVRYLGQTLV